MNNIKKLTQKDRYGNMISFEFDVPPMESIPHPGQPIGTDTVPAWLTPGERVMNAEAERMYGPMLYQMNEQGRAVQRAQGGTIPEYAAVGCKVNYKAQGGPVYAAEGMSPEQMSKLLANQVLSGNIDPRMAESALSNMGMSTGQAQAVIPSFALPQTQVPPTDYEAEALMGVREYPQVPQVPQTLSTELPPIRPQQIPTPTDYEGDVYAGRREYPQVPTTPGQLSSEPPQKVEDRTISTRSLLLEQEDMKSTPYKDTEGYWTVGVGHRITDEDTIKRLNNGESITYSDDQLMNWFEKDVNTATEGAKKNFDGFNSYSPKLQDALISMNYQLGTEGTRKFTDFRTALAKGDYETAKAELDNSDWATQTPSRVKYLKSVINEEAANRVGNKNTIRSTSGQPVVDSRFGVESTYRGQDTTPPVVSAPEMIDEFGVPQDVAGGMGDIPVYDDQALRMLRTQPQESALGKAINSAREAVLGSEDHRFNQDISSPTIGTVKPDMVEKLATQQAAMDSRLTVPQGSLDVGLDTWAEDDPNGASLDLQAPPVTGDQVLTDKGQAVVDKFRETNPSSRKTDEEIIAEEQTRVASLPSPTEQTAASENANIPNAKENAIKSVEEQTKNEETPSTPPETVEQKGNEVGETNPDAKSTAENFFKEWGLSDLFDKKEIGRMVAMYLGSRALGYSHGGSLNFAAKNYAQRIDTKTKTEAAQKAKLNEQAFQLAKEGKHSSKSIENYRRTGNLAYLDLGTSQGVGKGEYKEFFREGKKYRAQKIEMPDGSVQYRTDQGLTIDGSFNDDAAFHKNTPEYDKRRETANNNNVAIFEEAFEMAGGKDSDTNDWTQRLKVGPQKAAREFWAWAESARLDPNSNEARTIMNNAYQQALQDAKDGKIIIPSLEPYLKSQLFRENEIRNPDMFLLNPEEVADGKQMPKYVRQDQMNVLFDNVERVARKKLPNSSLTTAKKTIFDQAMNSWAGLSDPERQSWLDSTEKEAGVTGFYLYINDQLQKSYKN